MAKLSQIQVSFAPAEDRLLLRVSTEAQTEFQFWLTRRYVKLLWPILGQMITPSADENPSVSENAKVAIAEFERESALADADFGTGYDAQGAARPLGQAPVLVTRIQRKQSPTGAPILCMHPPEGLGIEVALDKKILHSLRALLSDAVAKAEWQLTLQPMQPGTTSVAPQSLN